VPPVPLVSSEKALAALRRLGCVTPRPARGSHLFIYRIDEQGQRRYQTMVIGKRQIKRRTLKTILDGLGIPVDQFIDAL
jgi:hypothetical protein